MNMIANIMKNYSEWIFRALLLLMVAANLWLTKNFVTREEYSRETKEFKLTYDIDKRDNKTDHLDIMRTVNDISIAIKLMAQNEQKLADHETRIRMLTEKQADASTRLATLERILSYTERDKP